MWALLRLSLGTKNLAHDQFINYKVSVTTSVPCISSQHDACASNNWLKVLLCPFLIETRALLGRDVVHLAAVEIKDNIVPVVGVLCTTVS